MTIIYDLQIIFEVFENFRLAILVLYFMFLPNISRCHLSSLYENKNQFIYLFVSPIITSLFPHHPSLNSKADPRKDQYPVILFRCVPFALFLELDEKRVSFAESSQLNFSPRRTINPKVHHLFPTNSYAFRAHTLRELRKENKCLTLLMTVFS